MMTLQENSPGALAGATGAETSFEAAKLHRNHSPKDDGTASGSFFWDRRSISVQLLRDLLAVALA